MICNKCGKEIRDDAIFCTSCGSEVQKQQVNSKKRGKSFFIVLCILVLVLCAGIIALLDVMRQNNAENIEITGSMKEKRKEDNSTEHIQELEKASESIAETQVVTEELDLKESTEEKDTQSEILNPLPENFDVEKEVEYIRKLYYETQENVDNFLQNEIDGITYYLDKEELVKAIVKSGVGNSPYTRNYYYEEGKIYFAFIFNGTEEYRFYFKDNCLIRYIDSTKTVYDYGIAEMEIFDEMCSDILIEAYDLGMYGTN